MKTNGRFHDPPGKLAEAAMKHLARAGLRSA